MNQPDTTRALQAAELLARYGSARTEAAIWGRIRDLNKKWAHLETAPADNVDPPREKAEAMGFQFALAASLGKAQAWLLSEDEVTELEKLVMGEERETVKQWRRKFPIEVSISAWFDGSVQASIQQYATQNVPNMGLLSRASVSSDVWQLQSFNARG